MSDGVPGSLGYGEGGLDTEPRVEAHILGLPTSYGSGGGGEPDWSPIAGLPENGWRIGLRFVSRLRDPIAFASLDRLRDQLARDCALAMERLMCAAPAEEIGR